MAKGKHRPSQRIILPNGMWILIYEDDGSVKLAGYDRRVAVVETLNRDGGAHVFVQVKVAPDNATPRTPSARKDDLVAVPRVRVL